MSDTSAPVNIGSDPAEETLRLLAAAKDGNSVQKEALALKTLKRYPLPLASGKECKFLENFGDKICKMLDDRLAKHVAEYGTTEPVDLAVESAIADASLLRLPQDGEEDDDLASLHIPVPPPRANTVHAISSSDDDNDELPAGLRNARPRKRKASGAKEKTPREYIPKYKSGPYALIVTLYNNLRRVESRRYMTKKELLTEAQPLSEKSFTIPDPGCRYTAWSSMGSIIRKGFVIKESSPAKYSLTDAGCALADRILQAEAGQDPGTELSPRTARVPDVDLRPDTGSRIPTDAAGFNEFDNLPDELWTDEPMFPAAEKTADVSLLDELKSARLKFWYISESGSTVLQKDQAAVLIDEEISIGFLVKAKYDDLLMSGKQYKVDTTRGGLGEYIYAFIRDDDADELANPPDGAKTASAVSFGSDFNGNKHYQHNHRMEDRKVPATSKQEPASSLFPGKGYTLQSEPHSSVHHKKNTRTTKRKQPPPSTITRHPSSEAASVYTEAKTVGSLTDIPSLSEDSQSRDSQQSLVSSVASSAPKFTLMPGTFDIILCVDNSEIYGKGCGKEALLKELQKSRVAIDVRKLQVGDFMWIARDKQSPPFGSNRKELVLNYIIERKRMDDLAGSIVDGRFKEQKFRMRNCGVQNQVYLVEAYGSGQNFSISEDTLSQAIANTQMIDNFYVKRTQDTKESAAYLVLLTRHLHSMYARKTLIGCSKTEVETYNKSSSLQDVEIALMTFQEFNEYSVKTKANSVQEMFGKQLVQLAGITVEKAAAVVDKYPTPVSLRQAYQRCFSVAEAENLLTSVKFGPMKRGVGKALSAMVYRLYNTDVLP